MWFLETFVGQEILYSYDIRILIMSWPICLSGRHSWPSQQIRENKVNHVYYLFKLQLRMKIKYFCVPVTNNISTWDVNNSVIDRLQVPSSYFEDKCIQNWLITDFHCCVFFLVVSSNISEWLYERTIVFTEQNLWIKSYVIFYLKK